MSVPPVAQIPRKSSAPPIIGIVAVALVMFIVVGGVVLYLVMGAAHNYQQQQAIASVYQQRKAAFDAFSARAKQHVFFRKNSDQLMADVRAINITGCPTDFQDKFLANVNALGELTIEVKSDTGAMGVI